MRRVRSQLDAMASETADDLKPLLEVDYRDPHSDDAKRLAESRDAAEIGWEAAGKRKAQEWAECLQKAFRQEGGRYPTIMARALELYDQRLPDTLEDWWSFSEDAEETEREADEFWPRKLTEHQAFPMQPYEYAIAQAKSQSPRPTV